MYSFPFTWYGIIWNKNVMERNVYEPYRIGRKRNIVECPTGLENSLVKQIVIILRNKIINDSKTIEPPIIEYG